MRLARAILLLVLLLASNWAGAQQPYISESGLETANYKYLAVVIESLGEKASEIGLTKERLRTHVELRVRSAGLTPGDDAEKNRAFLYAVITQAPVAFGVSVQYRRAALFETGGRTFNVLGITWSRAVIGQYGPHSAEIIMDGLDHLLDQFLNEYLKANQK